MSHQPLVSRLQREFKKLVEEIGIWVIYTRSDARFRCIACSDPDSLEGRDDCAHCFGTGFVVTLERWLVSHSLALRREKPAEIPRTAIGEVPHMPGFMFSRAEDIPRVGDRFFVVEWNQPRDEIAAQGAQPVRLVHAYRVLFAETHAAGAPIFHTAHLAFMFEQHRIFETLLLANPVRSTRLWSPS